MAGKVGQLMGVGVAANGDVWIADGYEEPAAIISPADG